MADHASEERVRLRAIVRGVVQGVGFRPFVFRSATELRLGGFVRNETDGVVLEVEGAREAVARFEHLLRCEAPPMARVEAVEIRAKKPVGQRRFQIPASHASSGKGTLLPPDTTTCSACLKELGDAQDRRYRYPFINCTNCGPRYTICSSLPYDRERTTMGAFKLCSICVAEYTDPTNRRFHAQPNACPSCGPRLTLVDGRGGAVQGTDPLAEAVERLAHGEIGAIKGLGGFHLACHAALASAVARLRERKGRPEKPFAVMVRNREAAEIFARLSEMDARLLETWRRPIVLLPRRTPSPLAAEVCASSRLVGVMLPYTPLHTLLLEGPYEALVMTSGNRSQEPLAASNDEALARLQGLADFFLLHDRPIHIRADDSVVRPARGSGLLIRRSRGYVPEPIQLGLEGPPVLAVGGDLKNTCCITRGSQAFLSQHIGDLGHPEATALLEQSVAHLRRLTGTSPELVVHDLHPDFHSTRCARRLFEGPHLAVQHHHAHALAVLAEHRWEGPALAICLDGLGLGSDGKLWGGEVLRVEGSSFLRLAHLKYLAVPGGDQAVREPWRMGVAALVNAWGQDEADELLALPPFLAAEPGLVEAVTGLARRSGACPLSSSAGRLFDAVASLLGVRHRVSFEGQAAMELEQVAAEHAPRGVLPYALVSTPGAAVELDLAPALRELARRSQRGVATGPLARLFHDTLAAALEEAALGAAQEVGLDTIALSGGVFQNRILAETLTTSLERAGTRVLGHRLVPPNDGGLSLGQAWAGLLHLQSEAAAQPQSNPVSSDPVGDDPDPVPTV